MDQVSFNYGKVEYSYWEQDASGKLSPSPFVASWDLKQNVK